MTDFFCPGRTELAGCHTDHQRGRLMAVAVHKGITAHAEPNGENVIRILPENSAPICVDLTRLWPEEKDVGTPTALVRGMAGILSRQGTVQGFDAYIESELAPGSGMASSAAFSVLVGYMIAYYSPDIAVTPEELARTAQKAESRWFGRSCCLMDPMACALGGCVYIDLLENKVLQKDYDFGSLGAELCLTDTGGDLSAAAEERTAITAHMNAVAELFGENCLARVRMLDFNAQYEEHAGELQWMRASHFFDENWRVSAMADALGLKDVHRYMELMNHSGRSAEILLQNTFSPRCGDGLSRGLALSARMLEGKGAWRAHGGGFAGRVQALMSEEDFPAYKQAMETEFGPGSCQPIRICQKGVGLAAETQKKSVDE